MKLIDKMTNKHKIWFLEYFGKNRNQIKDFEKNKDRYKQFEDVWIYINYNAKIGKKTSFFSKYISNQHAIEELDIKLIKNGE